MNMLQKRIADLVLKHDGLNAAARALKVDPGYLSRLASGEKDSPSDSLLRKMGLRRVVWYERRAPEPEDGQGREGDDLTPDEWKAMYTAQCVATDLWAKKAEAHGDAALLARIADLEAALAKVNERLTSAQNPIGRSLLRKPGDRPTVCYCPPGVCQAPKGFSGPCNRAPDAGVGMAFLELSDVLTARLGAEHTDKGFFPDPSKANPGAN